MKSVLVLPTCLGHGVTHHVTAMLHVCVATMSCLTVDDRNVLQDVESLACSSTEILLFACNLVAH